MTLFSSTSDEISLEMPRRDLEQKLYLQYYCLVQWWVRDLNVTANDRDIIERGDWLSDKVVDAVNCLMAKHLNIPDILAEQFNGTI